MVVYDDVDNDDNDGDDDGQSKATCVYTQVIHNDWYDGDDEVDDDDNQYYHAGTYVEFFRFLVKQTIEERIHQVARSTQITALNSRDAIMLSSCFHCCI